MRRSFFYAMGRDYLKNPATLSFYKPEKRQQPGKTDILTGRQRDLVDPSRTPVDRPRNSAGTAMILADRSPSLADRPLIPAGKHPSLADRPAISAGRPAIPAGRPPISAGKPAISAGKPIPSGRQPDRPDGRSANHFFRTKSRAS